MLVPTVGWRLAPGDRTVIGDHDELIDLWEIPAGEPFEEALARAAKVPAFGEVAAQLPNDLVAKNTQLKRPTPYCPTVA